MVLEEVLNLSSDGLLDGDKYGYETRQQVDLMLASNLFNFILLHKCFAWDFVITVQLYDRL